MSAYPAPPDPDPGREDAVSTARWLRRFQADMRAVGFTDETTAALLPTLLAHLLRSEDLLTESED